MQLPYTFSLLLLVATSHVVTAQGTRYEDYWSGQCGVGGGVGPQKCRAGVDDNGKQSGRPCPKEHPCPPIGRGTGECYVHKITQEVYCDGPPPGAGALRFLPPMVLSIPQPKASGSTKLVFQEPLVPSSFREPEEASGSAKEVVPKPKVASGSTDVASGPAEVALPDPIAEPNYGPPYGPNIAYPNGYLAVLADHKVASTSQK